MICYAVIFSMDGGGFATVPAYLRDMFGTRYVGAIHGLLLTAWSMAGVFGRLGHHPDLGQRHQGISVDVLRLKELA